MNEHLRRIPRRVVAKLKSDLENAARLPGCRDNGLPVSRSQRKRLLRVKVLAHLQDGDVEILVGPVRCGEHDGVDALLLVEHLAEVRPLPRSRARLADDPGGFVLALLQNVAHRNDLHAGHPNHVSQQKRAAVTDAHKRHTNCISCVLGMQYCRCRSKRLSSQKAAPAEIRGHDTRSSGTK
jgi:hypothetical protein